MWWNSKFWQNSVIILDSVKYGILQKRKWNLNIQRYMLLDFFCFKNRHFWAGANLLQRKCWTLNKFRPPLEKILATPQLMSVIVSFTISQDWNFVFFYIFPKHSRITLNEDDFYLEITFFFFGIFPRIWRF